MLIYPILVRVRGDIAHPLLVIEVPFDCFADAGLKGLSGFPSQFPIDLGSIDGVAAIMAGTIGDIGDLL